MEIIQLKTAYAAIEQSRRIREEWETTSNRIGDITNQLKEIAMKVLHFRKFNTTEEKAIIYIEESRSKIDGLLKEAKQLIERMEQLRSVAELAKIQLDLVKHFMDSSEMASEEEKLDKILAEDLLSNLKNMLTPSELTDFRDIQEVQEEASLFGRVEADDDEDDDDPEDWLLQDMIDDMLEDDDDDE